MITRRMQLLSVALAVLFLALVVSLVRRNRISLKYSLLWLLCGTLLGVLAVFPQLLDRFAGWLGIYSPVNALFAVLLLFGGMMMLALTAIISREKREIVRLTQEAALLEKRVRELEKAALSPEGTEEEP